MAASHGKNIVVYVNGVDLTTYFNDLTIGGEADTAEVSTFGSTYKAYVVGLVDGTVALGGVFDGAVGAVDATLAALLGVGTPLVSIGPNSDPRGNRAHLCASITTKYEITASISDAVMVSTEFQQSGGIGRGWWLHAKAATTGNQTAGSSFSVDTTTTSSAGYVANLHIFAVTGTTPTLDVELWDSADNSSFAVITGAVFPQQTAVGAVQLSSLTQTVRRYVAVKRTIGGTATPTFTHAISFAKR
jgi:hypothetical protein